MNFFWRAGTGDTARYFPDSLVDRLLRDPAKPPVVRGELSFTTDDFKPRWLPMPEGRFQLWLQPELGKYAPPGSYAWRKAEHLAGVRKGRMKSRW